MKSRAVLRVKVFCQPFCVTVFLSARHTNFHRSFAKEGDHHVVCSKHTHTNLFQPLPFFVKTSTKASPSFRPTHDGKSCEFACLRVCVQCVCVCVCAKCCLLCRTFASAGLSLCDCVATMFQSDQTQMLSPHQRKNVHTSKPTANKQQIHASTQAHTCTEMLKSAFALFVPYCVSCLFRFIRSTRLHPLRIIHKFQLSHINVLFVVVHFVHSPQLNHLFSLMSVTLSCSLDSI